MTADQMARRSRPVPGPGQAWAPAAGAGGGGRGGGGVCSIPLTRYCLCHGPLGGNLGLRAGLPLQTSAVQKKYNIVKYVKYGEIR